MVDEGITLQNDSEKNIDKFDNCVNDAVDEVEPREQKPLWETVVTDSLDNLESIAYERQVRNSKFHLRQAYNAFCEAFRDRAHSST